jgi:AcrR family transcriptional regulator
VTQTFTEDPGRRKKDATIRAIIDAAGVLLNEKLGIAPHAREIAAKSGYSVGTIYNYFTSVGDVVSHLVLKRQIEITKKIEAIIAAHDPDQPAETLCARIVESLFSTYKSVAPSVLRFAYNLAIANSAKPDQHERVLDSLLQPIRLVVSRDKTGTFRTYDDQELAMYLRGIFYLCRHPLLEGSPVYGTPDHQRIILNMMTRIMTQAPTR